MAPESPDPDEDEVSNSECNKHVQLQSARPVPSCENIESSQISDNQQTALPTR